MTFAFALHLQFTSALLGEHPQEPPICLRHGQKSPHGRMLVRHRSGLHGLLLPQRHAARQGKPPAGAPARFLCERVENVPVSQHAPTNKLLYAKDIPKFKQEVKAYYRQVREQPPITRDEFHSFLREESKVTLNKKKRIRSRREKCSDTSVRLLAFRSTRTSSTKERRSGSSTRPSGDTWQRSVHLYLLLPR